MSQQTNKTFEEAIAGLQSAIQGGSHEFGIDTPQFARMMFQVADEAGVVECRQINDDEFSFKVGDDWKSIYIIRVYALRSVLAAIAFFCVRKKKISKGSILSWFMVTTKKLN